LTSIRTAVLLLAHGSPDSAEDVPEFLLQITGGRPLSPAVIEEVKHRYGLIGKSPLTEMTLKQASMLQEKLGIPAYAGMRNWKPFLADTVRKMGEDGVTKAIVICMAPQISETSVGKYRAALNGTNPPFEINFIEAWYDHPLLIQAFAEKLCAGLDRAHAELNSRPAMIFTAHSVPQQGDSATYEKQTKETAALVAKAAGLAPDAWTFAFQSQGMSGGPWLGPTVENTIVDLKSKGLSSVFIQPIGFLCDHVEVLYDIDIGFKEFAEKEGVRLRRAESLNDSPTLTAALADIARSRLD
jgi:protoporphyrin/coproporphyrin ferrochelatase